MITDYVLVIIALVWLAAASLSDIKKREVANWLSFSLLAIALAIRAIGAVIFQQTSYFLYGLLGLAVFYIVAEIFYQTKIFGGGDAKLLISLGVVFATQPSFMKTTEIYGINFPFLAIFFFNILLCGSLYGIIYSIFLAVKNKKRFLKEFYKLEKKNRAKKYLIFALILMLIAFLAWTESPFFLISALIFLGIYPYLFTFVKAVENACMIKLASPNEITEGDWLASEIKVGRRVIKPKAEGLSIQEIRMIRKARLKVLIKHGIPFVPVFLIAMIISLFFNVLGKIISLFI